MLGGVPAEELIDKHQFKLSDLEAYFPVNPYELRGPKQKCIIWVITLNGILKMFIITQLRTVTLCQMIIEQKAALASIVL